MLYFVATPIGNLKDITLRALETLKSVDIIACEDTRHSLKLLSFYEIKKPLVSYHKFNELTEGKKIIDMLKEGKDVAVISDAGTPVVSDPGNVLVSMLIENGLEFTVIPGPNAFVPALILSGLCSSRFTFIGFLPEKNKERTALLEKFKGVDSTLIFYCAPHDVKKDVKDMYAVLGERKAVAVKEITKIHEAREEFNLKDGYPFEPKGEYVVLVEGKEEQNPLLNMSEKQHVEYYLQRGYDKKEAIKAVAKERGIAKSLLYKYTIEE